MCLRCFHTLLKVDKNNFNYEYMLTPIKNDSAILSVYYWIFLLLDLFVTAFVYIFIHSFTDILPFL